MPRMGTSRSLLRFNDEERVPVFLIFVTHAITRTLLSTDLRSGYLNGAQMCASPLH
jgi:hypothetical protein